MKLVRNFIIIVMEVLTKSNSLKNGQLDQNKDSIAMDIQRNTTELNKDTRKVSNFEYLDHSIDIRTNNNQNERSSPMLKEHFSNEEATIVNKVINNYVSGLVSNPIDISNKKKVEIKLDTLSTRSATGKDEDRQF